MPEAGTGRPTVGETRAFLAGCYGVAHADTTHYVITASACGKLTIATCCDGVREAASLLSEALTEITGRPLVTAGSRSVIVLREDLRTVLDRSAVIGPEVRDRLRDAAGLNVSEEAMPPAGPEGQVRTALGAGIRAARKRAGASQELLAGALGVTQTAVSYWESGKREPGLADLSRIAAALDIPLAGLIPGEPGSGASLAGAPGRLDPRSLTALAEVVSAMQEAGAAAAAERRRSLRWQEAWQSRSSAVRAWGESLPAEFRSGLLAVLDDGGVL